MQRTVQREDSQQAVNGAGCLRLTGNTCGYVWN